jgi:hypothetical protein
LVHAKVGDPATWPAQRETLGTSKRAHARASGIAWGTYGRLEGGGPPPTLHHWPETPHSTFLGGNPPGEVQEETPLGGGSVRGERDLPPPPSPSQEEFRASGGDRSPLPPPQGEPPPHAAPEARKEREKRGLRLVASAPLSRAGTRGGQPGGLLQEKEEPGVGLGGEERGAVWRA